MHYPGSRFKPAILVKHMNRPNSFGYIHTTDPFTVIWCLDGYVPPQSGVARRYSEPECVRKEDIVLTVCPGCSEHECYCGLLSCFEE